MASFNKVILIGNLVADPELKETQSGVKVCSFRIAVERKGGKGENKAVDFINIVAWRQTAEFVARWFTKGKSILVCGQWQNRQYDDKNGNKVTISECVADEVAFTSNKSDNNSPVATPTPDAPASTGYQNPFDETGYAEVGKDDDLPF